MTALRFPSLTVLCCCLDVFPSGTQGADPAAKITHTFLATGNQTYLCDDAAKEVWSSPCVLARRRFSLCRQALAGGVA
jgi:hypothetical protein